MSAKSPWTRAGDARGGGLIGQAEAQQLGEDADREDDRRRNRSGRGQPAPTDPAFARQQAGHS